MVQYLDAIPTSIKVKALHRIELLDRFYDLLDRKQLTFVKPKRWSDPLENIVFNATLTKNGTEVQHVAKDGIYSQCWSYENDSYALWQIYTYKAVDGIIQRFPGIRISTNYTKLDQLISNNKDCKIFCGVVKYYTRKDLTDLIKDKDFVGCLVENKINQEHLKTLLVKRKNYSYEKEIRLFCLPSKQQIDKTDRDISRINIEPVKFISKLRLDPIIDRKTFKKEKERLVDQYGFNPKIVTHSTYYADNDFKIII